MGHVPQCTKFSFGENFCWTGQTAKGVSTEVDTHGKYCLNPQTLLDAHRFIPTMITLQYFHHVDTQKFCEIENLFGENSFQKSVNFIELPPEKIMSCSRVSNSVGADEGIDEIGALVGPTDGVREGLRLGQSEGAELRGWEVGAEIVGFRLGDILGQMLGADVTGC